MSINAVGDKIDEEANADTDDLVRARSASISVTLASGGPGSRTRRWTGTAAIKATGNAGVNRPDRQRRRQHPGRRRRRGHPGRRQRRGHLRGRRSRRPGDRNARRRGRRHRPGQERDRSSPSARQPREADAARVRQTSMRTGNTLNNTLLGNAGANILDGGRRQRYHDRRQGRRHLRRRRRRRHRDRAKRPAAASTRSRAPSPSPWRRASMSRT